MYGRRRRSFSFSFLSLSLGFLLGIASLHLFWYWRSTPKTITRVPTIPSFDLSKLPEPALSEYLPRTFHLMGTLEGLSDKQLEEHETLYKGYVTQRNKIIQALKNVDRTNPNRTYTPFRSLKLAETYALNGQILHELYFENLTGEKTEPGKKTKKLIESSFGSFEYFKEDLINCAQVARGWAICAYTLDDKKLHNYVLEEHNQHVPIMVIPILVIDVYEHAYMIDYGIARDPYLAICWDHIDWNIVEKRIEKWIEKLS